ncbi:MAG TPA: TolC family protein [Bryobacteraceae bacterium]|nr:TolC family protein [Bryobacteraceae bacterium]
MKRYCCFLLCATAASAQGTLSLREAVEQALGSHPLLAAGTASVATSEALRRQVGLRPNPRLFLQTENLRPHGTPGFNFSEDADTYAYVSQLVETAGKRDRRVEVATLDLRRTQLERELLRRRIAQRVKLAYWNAATAQKLHALLQETAGTFRQILDYHEARVREGAMAEADLLRVRLESERLAIAANSAGLDAERARIELFREMGASDFPAVEFTERIEPLGAGIEPDVNTALAERTEVKLGMQAVERARANQRLQESLSKPDVDFLVGYKRTAGFHTMLGGVQVNLPFRDRNQGNLAAAASQVRMAESELAAAQASVRAEVKAARTEFEIRRKQAASLPLLRDHAYESSRIAQAAYREGGTDLLRLLDAERVRIDAQVLYYRTLSEYQQSRVALETAMGVEP